MANYYYTNNLKQTDSSLFREIQTIGSKPNAPGIYKCQRCGFEDVINRECDTLPPCSHCKSRPGRNTWKLLVQATDE